MKNKNKADLVDIVVIIIAGLQASKGYKMWTNNQKDGF